LPQETTSKIFLKLHETADKITQRVVKRILGSTPAVIPLSALREDRSMEEEKKIEEAEARKTEAKKVEREGANLIEEMEAAKVKDMEMEKLKEIEGEFELNRARDDKMWFNGRGDVPRKSKEGRSEIEEEGKREKERLEKIKNGPPRSEEERVARAQENVLSRKALDREGLSALEKQQDAYRLAYEKYDADQAKDCEEFKEWKEKYMEEEGLSSEEEFEDSLAYEEGAWDVYKDLMETEWEHGDEGEYGDEGWYEGGFDGDDEGGFGWEDSGGFGERDEGEDEGRDEGTHEYGKGKEKKGKGKGPGGGAGGGESGGSGGGGGGG
jgi:hypothetical protein